MHGVKGVTNDLTSGRSVLRPAPIERIPELVLENLNARGVVNTVKLLKSGSQISSYRSGPSGAPVPSNYQSPQSFRSTPSYQPEPHYRPEPSFQPTPSYQPTPSFQPTPTYERQYISQPVQQSYQPQQYYYYNDDD
jgi:hypothetical protein